MKRILIAVALIGFSGIIFYMFFLKNNTISPKPSEKKPVAVDTLDTEKNKDTMVIVAFGDSLTAGYGINIQDSYPAQLEQKLQDEGYTVRVINMGVSGETTTGGLDRVDFVLKQDPDLILLGLGANDMLRGTSPSTTRKNLDTILSKIAEKEIPVVLLGMQSAASNGSVFASEFNKIYGDLAKKYKTELVPFFLKDVVLNPSLNIADGIHPNKEGYAYIVENHVLEVVRGVLKRL